MWISPSEYKVVGSYLEDLRTSANVTQKELAALLGKPQSFVSSYESGQRRIDVLELIRIVDALGGNAQAVCRGLVDTILAAGGKARKARARR